MTPALRVLYVGADIDPVRGLQERSDAEFTICLAASPEDALARLGAIGFDCVVAGEEISIERFLHAVTDAQPGLPRVVRADADALADLDSSLYDRAVTDDTAVPEAVLDLVAAADPGDSSNDGGAGEIEYRTRHAPLWENPTFMEAVLDNLLDVFFVFTVDRELVEWNTRLESVTGRSAAELSGADPFEFIAPEHREEAFTSLGSVLTEGRATGEFDLVSVEGERTPFEFVASLVTQDDAPQYICGIGRDVTDLRQKQAELERKQEELDAVIEELKRSNAELEQFAYVASHDMKQPLRMVRNYLELLERRYGADLTEDATEYVEFAIDGARRLQSLIDQLLTYSRIDREGDAFREVNCQSVFDIAQRNLEIQIQESGADIETEGLPTVTGDHDQLVQLFQNLLSNAIKYNEGTPHVHVSATQEGDVWEFAVTDDGIGIPEERIEHVFETFYGDATGVEEVESTGIGLAICERIVERHGGDIWVESTPGEGSTFYFTLADREVDQQPVSASLDELTTAGGQSAK